MYRLAIFALFLGSGLCGLIYQVVWTRLLTLSFGVTLLAVSTVLTAFFGGLALGSFLGGRWIDRRGNGFKWYGVAELLIGVYALVFPLLLEINNSVYVAVGGMFSAGFYSLSLFKFALALLLLIIPTTLMGATLPMLSRAVASSSARFARDVGSLYAVNTAGAVAGAVLTAFVFIPSLGISAILYSTGALNIIIGGSALLLSSLYDGGRAPGAPPESPGDPSPQASENRGPLPPYFSKILIWGFAFSGFSGLVYEVIWTRVIGFMLTGTVYAFAAVLAVFLAGIAFGSFVFSTFIDRIRSRAAIVMILASVEMLIGLSSIWLITLYDRLPALGFYKTLESTPVWGEFVYLNFLTSFVTLIAPTFLFGATFPLVCKVYNWRETGVGTKIGEIYSVNTVGGILGSFAGGFLLVPFVGMQNSIILTGFINIAVGAAFILFNPFGHKKTGYAFLSAGVIAAVALTLNLPEDMPRTLHKGFLKKGEEIVFYREGAAATVMIAEKKGEGLAGSNKRLWVNGNRATAAFYEGLQINRFQGVLPMVLHPDPRDVLVICFGSGTTFGTLSQFPVRRVDNVEIASTVIEGAPYFKFENMDVLNNPVSRIIIDDGRSYLTTAGKKYDVITEEPMHPSLAGVVNLYTREYYELAKAHLKEGGIMSQWIPLYNLSISDVRVMVRTFSSVFPHTSVWIANTDIFMIGSPERLEVDFGRVVEKLKMPNVHALLKDIDLEDPYEFLNTFLMNEEMTGAYAEGGSVMGDDLPSVEFTGPRSLHVNTISPNIGEFLRFREPVTRYLFVPGGFNRKEVYSKLERKYASGKYNLVGRAYFADSNIEEALRYFKAATAIDPEDRNSIHYLKNLRRYQATAPVQLDPAPAVHP